MIHTYFEYMTSEYPADAGHGMLRRAGIREGLGRIRPHEWRLQDLLVISLGRPVRIDHLAVRPREETAKAPLRDVACQMIQPGNWSLIRDPAAPTLSGGTGWARP